MSPLTFTNVKLCKAVHVVLIQLQQPMYNISLLTHGLQRFKHHLKTSDKKLIGIKA